MRVLIAEDEAISRRLLQARLTSLGYEVVVTRDGAEAWAALQAPDAPRLAVLDWMMPGMSGPEVCQQVRIREAREGGPYRYILLLTAKSHADDEREGRDSGADGYLEKPFDAKELDLRLREGLRMLEDQASLTPRASTA